MQKWPKNMLMVSPLFFDVLYSINPHMTDKDGKLNKVDKPLAINQWKELKKTFESTGQNVAVIDGQKDLPDMVFCANQTFPYLKDGAKHIILSKMHSEKRHPEVS